MSTDLTMRQIKYHVFCWAVNILKLNKVISESVKHKISRNITEVFGDLDSEPEAAAKDSGTANDLYTKISGREIACGRVGQGRLVASRWLNADTTTATNVIHCSPSSVAYVLMKEFVLYRKFSSLMSL